jgi:HK97 family phage major capsid protein
MASPQIAALVDELTRIAAEMSALLAEEAPQPSEDEGDAAEAEAASTERDAKLAELEKRSDKITKRIAFLEKVEAKEREIRSVVNRASPAPEPAEEQKEERATPVEKPFAVPVSLGNLRAFKGPNAEERAYRAGMWLRSEVFGDKHAERWCRDHGIETRATSEAVQGRPGGLVIDEVLNTVIKLVDEYGTFPANARRVPMQSDVLIVPKRKGGLTAEFVGENTLIPDSDPTWEKVTLTAKKLVVSNRCSSEFLEDSTINLADYIVDEFARAFAEKIDACGWVGDGSAAYGSMTGAAGVVGATAASLVTAAAGGVGFETLKIDTFTAAVGLLPQYAQRNARWYVSPAGYAASMQRLGLAVSGGIGGGNTADNLARGMGLSFLGFPVVLVHSLNTKLGSDPGKVKVLFGDLTLSSLYGVRREMTVKTSTERYAELDQTLLLATTRFACLTHDAGPLVGIKTAAS